MVKFPSKLYRNNIIFYNMEEITVKPVQEEPKIPQPIITKTAEELGQAIKNNADTIEIQGDLANKVFKIKATGKVVWAVALGALGVAVACIILQAKGSDTDTSTQAGSAITFTGAAGGTAVAAGILGKAAIVAASIAAAAGGVGALTSLRDKYKIIERAENKLILQHK